MTNPMTEASRTSRVEQGRLSGQELYELHALCYRDANGLTQPTWHELGKARKSVFHNMAMRIHDHYVSFGSGK